MSSEIQVRTSLQVTNGALNYLSRPTSFSADQANIGGPTPGEIAVAVTGTDVSLAQLTAPGICRIMNLDPTNFVEWGLWVGGADFFPLGRILPGETYIIRLSPHLGLEYGVGTGTIGSGATWRFKADTAACKVLIEAFET